MPTPPVPQFRSLSQIVGDMVTTFLSELDRTGVVPGIQSLKPGSPYLAIFEATGQSQFRNQGQSLSLLDANDLDNTHGERLDRIGAAEKLPRRAATFASGIIDVSDTSFTKVSTSIWQGSAAPIPGATTLNVVDASGFDAAGSLYIGRGTINVEGPLTYNGVVDNGTHWTITLTAPTTNFHGLGESVVFAQGGDRVIPAGQLVSTPESTVSEQAVHATTSQTTLLDGETSVTNVRVVARKPGVVGNVSAGGLRVVQTPAFTGMAVTNPRPISNGLDIENDDLYRERIKAARRSRYGIGTDLGVEVRTYGVQAPDEAATVTSSQYVTRSLLPSLLVIDDGTGYEAKADGVALEVLMDSASGGEDVFFLAKGYPVAKPSVTSAAAAPFALVDEMGLTVVVGGVAYIHAFDASQFVDISNATAYEVVASINSNPNIPFSASTSGAGKYVVVFAKDNVNDDIEVIETAGLVDANTVLRFPGGRIEAVALYRNDVLLSKDGLVATLISAPQMAWSPMSSGETLIISVDGTPYLTFTITDSDVIATGDGVAVSAMMPLATWAKVFNAKVPGITCSVTGDSLTFSSNAGKTARAAVSIDPASSLVVKGMFTVLTAQGRERDYILDRNRGQVELVEPLDPGDSLTAGSYFTRAYVQSASALGANITIPAGDANLWFVVDGDAVPVAHGLNGSHTVNHTATAALRTYEVVAGTPTNPFANVRPGDFAVWSEDPWDGSGAEVSYGSMRVSEVAEDGSWFKCQYVGPGASGPDANVTDVFERLRFVRSSVIPRRVHLPAGVYAQAALVAAFNLPGASASFADNKLRVTTNTFGEYGDIALIAQDTNAAAELALTLTAAIENDYPQTAAVESGNSEVGSPDQFTLTTVTSFTAPLGPTAITALIDTARAPNGYIEGGIVMRAATVHSPTVTERWGTLTGHKFNWYDLAAGAVMVDDLHEAALGTIDRVLGVSNFRIGPLSDLNVVFDNDPVSKGYSIPMSVEVQAVGAVPYGQNIRLSLSGGASLSTKFGTGFDFANFVLHAHGRSRFDLSAQPGNTDTMMLRLKSWTGRDGDKEMLLSLQEYAATPLSIVNLRPRGDVLVLVGTGASRGVVFTANDYLLMRQVAPATTATLVSAFALTSIARAGNTVTVVLTAPTADVATANLAAGMSVYISTADVNFPSGFKTVDAAGLGALTFQYTEAGAAVAGNVAGAWMGRNAAPVDFTGVVAGDYISFPGLAAGYWNVTPNTLEKARLRVTAVDGSSPSHYVRLTATTATSGWVQVALADDIDFFPLDRNTTAEVVTDINALATSSIAAALADGPGTGVISQVETAVAEYIADGALHVGSSSWNAGAGHYDFILKQAPSASLATVPNDWDNEVFRLTPATAKNIADYLARGQVTGLASAGVSLLTSSTAHKVQLASGVLGSEGSVQVSGGSASAVRLPVISAVDHTTSISVDVLTTSDIEAISNRCKVWLDNARATPKVTDWDATTRLVATSGTVDLQGAGSAWAFSQSPGFGTKWVAQKTGDFLTVLPTLNAPTLAKDGAWVHFEPGMGKWKLGTPMTDTLVGRAFATLSDGRIIAIGGTAHASFTNAAMGPSDQVEIYDPTTGVWTAKAVLPAARMFGAAVTLANGNVLFTGGISGTGPGGPYTWHADGYIYDVAGNSWAATTDPAMVTARAHHTMTLMSDGHVIIVGGSTALGTSTAATEEFDPSTETFSALLAAGSAVGQHKAFHLGMDRVLVVGTGYQVYDHVLSVWTHNIPFAGAMAHRYGAAVVQMSSLSFLVAGGTDDATHDPGAWTAANTFKEAEVFDVSAAAARSVASMPIPRAGCDGALVLGNKAVVWGGRAELPSGGPPSYVAQRSAVVFDTQTETWTFASGTVEPRLYAPALRVSDTEVLVAGGVTSTLAAAATVEAFDPTALAAPASNVGTFRLLNSNTEHLLIEAPNAETGEWEFGYVAFYTYNSIMPGDKLRVSSTIGTMTAREYEVSALDLYDTDVFTVKGGYTFDSGVLGGSLPFVSLIAAAPARMLYTVRAIAPDDSNVGQSFLDLVPPAQFSDFTAEAGSVLTVLDKLEFPTGAVAGRDGYRYNTGLVAEVNRVVYGDETDSVTYPGVASGGADIDVSAPLIRRVTISLAIRVRAGTPDVVARVQSAVAAAVNSAPPGSIAISVIISAVQKVDGVLSVVMLSPVPTTGADAIPVQPYEKALVLNPANDVQVSFIGA